MSPMFGCTAVEVIWLSQSRLHHKEMPSFIQAASWTLGSKMWALRVFCSLTLNSTLCECMSKMFLITWRKKKSQRSGPSWSHLHEVWGEGADWLITTTDNCAEQKSISRQTSVKYHWTPLVNLWELFSYYLLFTFLIYLNIYSARTLDIKNFVPKVKDNKKRDEND